jgi:hypothetical protein
LKNLVNTRTFLFFISLIWISNWQNIYPQTDNFIEKVWLHVDRDRYNPGDDIWFKAYLIDASDRLLTSHSNNLHVELISPDLSIADSRIIKMTNGLGKGDFSLPQKIKSGKYRIRAYTNYMRNFGDQLFYYKEITIINTSDAVKTFSLKPDSIKDQLEISFYPEGGSLVDNVVSKVAFKTVDANGEGRDVTGEIRSSTGESVTTFRSTHSGMGTFSISPVPGKSYLAVVKDQFGDSINIELPVSFPTGIVLSISRDSNNNLLVTVRTNAATFSALSENNLSLIVSSRNVFLKKADFRLKSLSDRFILPVNDLPEGIVSLTLAGAKNTPLCERLVYLKNNDDVHLNLETGKSVYNQRDSVSLKVTLADSSANGQDAFLSLSATNSISGTASSGFPSSISSWFLLESDVRGKVEEPSYYFDPSNPDRLKDLDLLLLTQGWRDFKWKYNEPKYPSEHGFLISGRTRKKFIKDPLVNEYVNLALFKGGNPLINTVITDSAGRFTTEEFDMTGKAELIASSTGKKEKPEGWIILDSLRYLPAELNPVNYRQKYVIEHNRYSIHDQTVNDLPVKNENLTSYIQYAEIRNSTLKKYKLSDTINPGEVTITARRQEKPESPKLQSQRYLLCHMPDVEYTIVPKSEIFANLGLLINFRLHKNIGGMGGGTSTYPPLVLLNGMQVVWESISYLPVAWIDRFDYVSPMNPAAMMWGEKAKGGVISVITRDGALENSFNKVYHTAQMKFTGYDEPRIFYSPRHQTTLEKDYKPDLRTTLFWEPDLKVQGNNYVYLNFFNGDNPAKVKIVAEGITTGGIPVTGVTEYEIK